MLTLLLVGAYLGSVSFIRRFLPADGHLPVAISTLAIAALFNPLRRRIQRLVDRRFNRAHYDAELALIDFGERLRAGGDLASLGDEVAAVVEGTMHAILTRPLGALENGAHEFSETIEETRWWG